MKITLDKLTRFGGVGIIALTLGLTGCHHGDRTMGQAFNDRMTAHDVKKALSKSPIYKFEDVSANVFDGNVQLTGFVETQQQRDQAAKIVSGVQGVKEVVNDIMLKPTPTGRATIRDNRGRETGQLMIGTNAPANTSTNWNQ